jgi:hypothetical protein
MLHTNGRHRRRALLTSAFALAVAALVAGCGGGGTGSTPPAAMTGAIPAGSASKAAALKPAAAPTPTFNPWPMYGFDTSHDGYNPNTANFTDASISALHLAWKAYIGELGSQTQPVLATNVGTHLGMLFVGGRNGTEVALDALTGKKVWTKSFGTMQMDCVNNGPKLTLGIQATSAYDPVNNVMYVVDESSAGGNAPQTITVYKLDPATGNVLGSVPIVTPQTELPNEIDFAHTGLTLAGNMLYVGTGTTCDLSSWRGRNTFYPVWSQAAQYSGGGVWGWGGAAVDASGNVYVGTGNADINKHAIGPQPPFITTTNEQVAYGEHLVQLSNDVSTVESSFAVQYPFSKTVTNLDLSGTPVLFTPVGCPTLLAVQGKAGLLNFYNTATIDAGPLTSYAFSEPGDQVSYIGNGAYSPITGFYYANIATGQAGPMYPAGMAAIGSTGCQPNASVSYHTAFGSDSFNIGTHNGQPRSAPTVTAGNVVFVASPTAAGTSQVWALDATNLNVLNGASPLFTTSALVRMPPTIDADWMYVMDQGGHLYAYTVDPNVPALKSAPFPVSAPDPTWVNE